MDNPCFLNGEWLPLAEARVSVLDRGFLFGDGVYEVVPAYNGKLFYWQRHMERLRASLRALALPYADAQVEGLRAIAQELVAKHGGGNMGVYLQITRGAAAKRQQAPPANCAPTTLMFRLDFPPPEQTRRWRQTGAHCVSAEDFRWRRGDIKCVSLAAAALAANAAQARGADETVWIRDGALTEGGSCNYIVARGRELISPLADSRMLRGITYQIVMQLARELGCKTTERDIARAELFAADEVWLASSLRELAPVTRIDDAPIGDGKPGPLFAELLRAWHGHIAAVCPP